MPKMKTRKSAAKRFTQTGSGKVKRNKAYHSHILTKKTTQRKRGLRQGGMVDQADLNRVKKMIVA